MPADKYVINIMLLAEFTVWFIGNAWTKYDEQYRAGLCQAGIIFIIYEE